MDPISSIWILFGLLIFWIYFVASVVWNLLSSPTGTGLNAATVQAGATIILAGITVWYAVQTKRNADLFRRQLDLEVRRNHADTLQIRTQTWLDNFPAVMETDIPLFEDQPSDDALAVPPNLRNDPYFEDLTENHASDLQDHIDEIQLLYSEFQSLREDYVDTIDSDAIFPDIRQLVVLERNYAIWLFERVLLLERTQNGKDDLQQAVENAFEHETYEEDDVFYLIGDVKDSRRKPILAYHYLRSFAQNRKDTFWFRYWSGISKAHIRDIESIPGHADAVSAAEVLDDIDAEFNQLHRRLVEYNERPRFQGDCEHIQEINEID